MQMQMTIVLALELTAFLSLCSTVGLTQFYLTLVCLSVTVFLRGC